MADWNKLPEHVTRKRGKNEIKGTRRDFESFYCGRGKKGHLKAMLWDVLYWECGWSQSAIARAFGVNSTTVCGQVTQERWEKNNKYASDNQESGYFGEWMNKSWENRFKAYTAALVRHRPEYAEDVRGWTSSERQAVSKIYEECYKRCQEDGDRMWHVDHIVPYTMGGRHVPENLRILTREDNVGRPKDGSDIIHP